MVTGDFQHLRVCMKIVGHSNALKPSPLTGSSGVLGSFLGPSQACVYTVQPPKPVHSYDTAEGHHFLGEPCLSAAEHPHFLWLF